MTASDNITKHLPVITDIITVSPSTYARAAMSRLAGRWWWVAVAPMIIFLIASLWNTAYLFAAFMWLLMLLPPAIMLAYYSYLLTPVAAAMSQPHRITINHNRVVTINFEPTEESTDLTRPSITLQSEKISCIIEKADHIEINYNHAPVNIVIIPYNSLQDTNLEHTLTILHNIDN